MTQNVRALYDYNVQIFDIARKFVMYKQNKSTRKSERVARF